MKAIGQGQSRPDPSICSDCEEFVIKRQGGAELDAALLFVDIQGSTNLAKPLEPAEFGKLLNRFYRTVTDVIVNHKGFVEKLVGDEATAFFEPGLRGMIM